MAHKQWLSPADQAALLVRRGLIVGNHSQCRDFLSRNNYYRFSGYARYFQIDPARGDNRFRDGVTFDEVRQVQSLDALLRDLCQRHLSRIETALRARFALRYGELVSPYEKFWSEAAYHSVGSSGTPVHELVLRDLDRSKVPFITRHRSGGNGTFYADLPVWAAVEVLSFGTLSKCIEYCVNDQVRKKWPKTLRLPTRVSLPRFDHLSHYATSALTGLVFGTTSPRTRPR